MKKITLSLIISLAVNLVGALINYIYYQFNRHLFLCFRSFGGEITVESGFGLIAVHIYAMEPNSSDSLHLRFEPLAFIVWLLAIALIVFLILFLIGKIRKK
ncbi:MAG: hypothetical protein J5365_01950 [Erysipelotrichaceae bacterium]|nr:hypothetical protein [Erysipelotrichaceae bacterium]